MPHTISESPQQRNFLRLEPDFIVYKDVHPTMRGLNEQPHHDDNLQLYWRVNCHMVARHRDAHVSDPWPGLLTLPWPLLHPCMTKIVEQRGLCFCVHWLVCKAQSVETSLASIVHVGDGIEGKPLGIMSCESGFCPSCFGRPVFETKRQSCSCQEGVSAPPQCGSIFIMSTYSRHGSIVRLVQAFLKFYHTLV